MIKRLMMATSVVALMLGSSFAMAAETVTVQLKADIPADGFYVRPAPGVDLNKVQSMNWNVQAKKLDALKIDLDMFSSKDINAKLDAAAALYGPATIPLTVKVGGIAVPVTGATVATATQASATGFRQTLSIEADPAAPAKPYPQGAYSGAVSVIFEPAK